MRSRTPSVDLSLEPLQLERQRRPGVAHELPRRHEPGRPGRAAHDERRRAGDQRAVEVEERGARPAADHAAVRASARALPAASCSMSSSVSISLVHGARLGGGLLRARAAVDGSRRRTVDSASASAVGEVVRHTLRDAEPAGDRGRGVAARRARPPARRAARPGRRRRRARRRTRARRRRRRRTRRAARRGRRRRACRCTTVS